MQPEREADPPSRIRHQSHLMPFVEIMPDRQHTMRAVAIGAFVSAPDVGAGTLGRRPASSADRFRVSSQDRGLPLAISELSKYRRSGPPGFFLGGSGYSLTGQKDLSKNATDAAHDGFDEAQRVSSGRPGQTGSGSAPRNLYAAAAPLGSLPSASGILRRGSSRRTRQLARRPSTPGPFESSSSPAPAPCWRTNFGCAKRLRPAP